MIRGKRIRKLDQYIKGFAQGDQVVVVMRDLTSATETLKRVGFSEQLEAGESVLPSAVFGSISEFNAYGKDVPQKDQPKETAFRTIRWTWQEFHGRQRIERSEFRDVPYERYPRKHFPPPSVELQVAINPDGEKLVVAEAVDHSNGREKLLHTVNLFLELFGECELLSESLRSVIRAKVLKLNWHLLPPGKLPWKTLAPVLEPIIRENAEGNQPFVVDRLNKINGYAPEFVAFGRGGFHGYVVFGFPKKRLYVLESALHGNATYAFDENWERLSQLTKAEILDGGLQKARVIHLLSWYEKMNALLK